MCCEKLRLLGPSIVFRDMFFYRTTTKKVWLLSPTRWHCLTEGTWSRPYLLNRVGRWRPANRCLKEAMPFLGLKIYIRLKETIKNTFRNTIQVCNPHSCSRGEQTTSIVLLCSSVTFVFNLHSFSSNSFLTYPFLFYHAHFTPLHSTSVLTYSTLLYD